MKILGVIPARWASTRLPGKPLADICGKPMIQHVYERASLAKLLDDIVVATDDERVFNCVRSFGGNAVMTSPELPNGTARAEQAARSYKNIEAVINIQGDEPLLNPLMVDEVAEILTDNMDKDVQCVTLCRELSGGFENPNTVKVVLSQSSDALYFSRSLIPYMRNKTDLPVYQHIGIYGYTLEFLKKYVSLPSTPLSEAESLEQLKILEHGYKIKVKVTQCNDRSIGVDTQEDLTAVREILSDSRTRNESTGNAGS